MVIEDLSDLNKTNSKTVSSVQTSEILAPSSDRLIANFLDILLHFPLFNFFVSVFLRKLRLLKWVTESNTETLYVFIQCAIIILFAILVFQAIYTKVLSFTPGMYLMKLRLRSCNSVEISWGQAFLRAFIWIIGMLAVGIPFLEIFSHKKKKLIHDRASETEIYTLKKSFIEVSPLAIETSMVRLFFISIALAFLGWINAFISMSQNEIESGRLAISEFTERGMLCDEVDEISLRSHIDIQNPEARLEFAASLFMLGQMDQSCLNKELDFADLKNQGASNRFFVKALVVPAYSEDRKKYLELGCKQDKKWCDTSFLIEDSSGTNLKENLAKVERTWEASSWTYKVAALKLFNHLGQSELVLQVISNLQETGLQATGLIEYQVKALQRLNREKEIKEVLRGIRSVVINKDYARLNSELCLQNLDASCIQTDFSCKNFIDLIPANKDLLAETGPARTVFKYFNCKRQLNENMEYWSLIENESLQEILQWALYIQEPSMKATALSKLRVFVDDKAKPKNLRWDALQLLLNNTNYDKDWLLAVRFWKEFSPHNDSYLSASHWLVSQAKVQRKESQIASLEKILNENPGYLAGSKIQLQAGKINRLPAEVPQITEKK
jgi:uncharacterized RDD family membrane protein YckC